MKKIILLSQLLTVNFVFAQNWIGFQDADWNNSANWSSWPLNGQSIVIDPALYSGNAVSPVISANSVFSPAAVLMQNGALLIIDADLTTQDDFEVIGAGTSLIMNNGVLNVNPGNGGRLIIDLGATMQINGGNTIVDERFIAGEDAIVTINGGTASSGERLLMDLGGRFIQNNGTVNVAATFAMADGSLNSNSSYELNGGTLNVTGEFAMENESGIFEPSFVQNGGILNVNGDVFWFGTAPGAGTPRFIMNAGIATISGIIQNMPLSTVNMYLRLDGSSALNYNGNLIENIHPEDSVIQTGNSSFILNNTCTLNNAGEFLAENVTITFNGNTMLSGTGNYQFATVLIEPSAVLNHFSPGQIRISGDFNQNGLFNANSNELLFNGAMPQFINGTSSLQAHHMTIDNSMNGLTLQIPVNMTGNLQLTSGVLYTDVVNILSLADNATSGSGNAISFVNGPVKKVGDDSFVFPVGKNGKWSRIGISAPALVTEEFVAEYFVGSYSSISPVNSPLSAVSNLEYWELNRQAGTSDVWVELYWEDASTSSITDCNELSVASWNGTSWENVFSTASGTCSGTGSGSILSNAPWSNYGAFTFGFYSGVTSQNFTICNGDSIVVGANVYTTSGAYIDVLQDVNLNDSIVITNLNVIIVDTGISVAGITLTSNSVNATYLEWIDCSNNAVLLSGTGEFSFTPDSNGFYALIVHENFCVDTSACVEINSAGIEQQYLPEIVVYPNPFDRTFTVELPTYQEYALIELLDLAGQTIVSLKPELDDTFVECDIPSGIYFLQITQKSGERALKKIVRK